MVLLEHMILSQTLKLKYFLETHKWNYVNIALALFLVYYYFNILLG